ncbi:unnamed protein product, partial [Polarella glacialis]
MKLLLRIHCPGKGNRSDFYNWESKLLGDFAQERDDWAAGPEGRKLRQLYPALDIFQESLRLQSISHALDWFQNELDTLGHRNMLADVH